MADDSRISPYNLADCKNTTDDVLTNYLNSIKFRQTHYYTDVRLVTGWAAVIICAITFAYDYRFGFESTKYYTAGTVLVYFALNTFFTYWLWFVEGDIAYTGEWNGQKITIRTKAKKHDPTYRLTFSQAGPTGSEQQQQLEVSAPFTKWFTADGYIVPQPLQQWLASSIPLIAQADPKTATASSAAAQAAPFAVPRGAFSSGSDATKSSAKKRTG